MSVEYSQQIRKVLNEVDKYLKGWGLDVRNKTKHYFCNSGKVGMGEMAVSRAGNLRSE